jgi:hypothetical protein
MHTVIEGKPGEFLVILLRENLAVERELRSFFTIQSADAYVKGVLSQILAEDYEFYCPPD